MLLCNYYFTDFLLQRVGGRGGGENPKTKYIESLSAAAISELILNLSNKFRSRLSSAVLQMK